MEDSVVSEGQMEDSVVSEGHRDELGGGEESHRAT